MIPADSGRSAGPRAASRALPGLLIAALVVLCAVMVLVPMVLIRPFVRQTGAGLAVAYALRAWAPAVSLAGLAAAAGTAVVLWPRLRGWIGRSGTVLSLAALAACVWMARQNIFERIFHPIERPVFVEASAADHVQDADLILGVRHLGEARAYPVRALAYHHLVNDVIAGEPIVGTY